MKVLIIPTWYPNGEDKLMGIYHKEFAEALVREQNVEVNMLYIDRQKLSKPISYLFMKKKEVIYENGYNTYTRKMLDIHKISVNLQLKKYCHILENAFKNYLKKNGRPDIIHAQVTLPAGYAACLVGKKYHIPVVVSEHASYFERFFQGSNKKYGDYVFNNSYFTTVSSYMKKRMLEFKKECDLLPNLVATEDFIKPRKKITGIRLITVVALRKQKHVDDIIAALKIIIEEKKIKDARLTVVGDGFDEEFYKKRCTELNMDEYVDFVGRKTKKEIADILTEHNIYVLSSDVETFGIPVIEAFASGIPVVATRCLGPEELIDSKCGKLIPVGDPKKMSEAIVQVYNNLDKYDVEYIKSVAKRYSAKNITAKAMDIYKKLLK